MRALIDESTGDLVRTRLSAEPVVAAPELIDLEFMNVVRALLTKGSIHLPEAELALAEFWLAPIDRYSHRALVPRIWQLGQNLTAYDSAYVALTEMLGAELLTIDRGISAASGILCPVTVIGSGLKRTD